MLEECLRPTQFIDSDHPSIQKRLDDLGVRNRPALEQIGILFRFVRDDIPFSAFAPMVQEADYKASVILDRGFGFCVQKAVLLAALCRGAGIPCQLGFADIRNHLASQEVVELIGTNLFVYHGYDVVWLEGKWVKATPTFDRALCERTQTLVVEFDGVEDAMLPAFDRAGRKHIEYLRHIGRFSDVPVKDILSAFWTSYVRDNPKLLAMWEGESTTDGHG